MGVVVTSLDPSRPFQKECKTLDINAHGCGVIVGQSLPNGTPVGVELQSSRNHTNGRIVVSLPLGDDRTMWLLGIEFESAGNFWGIQEPPPDWL